VEDLLPASDLHHGSILQQSSTPAAAAAALLRAIELALFLAVHELLYMNGLLLQQQHMPAVLHVQGCIAAA
jgi:hypothetical protein